MFLVNPNRIERTKFHKVDAEKATASDSIPENIMLIRKI